MFKMLLSIFCIFILKSAFAWEPYNKIYDLSWPFNNETIYWLGQRPFEFTKQQTINGGGFTYTVKEYCMAEHGGTHFDAPYHFNLQGWKIGDIPLQRLFAKGALINLTREHELLGRNIRLTAKHLEDWERRNGKFESGTVLLIKFGRSRYWPDRKTYLDLDSDNTTMNFPGLSGEAAQWIADSGKFYGIGLDTPSIDPGNSTDFIAHVTLAKYYLYNLENVKLLVDLPEKDFNLIIAPTKIEEGTGAPVRIFAEVPKHQTH